MISAQTIERVLSHDSPWEDCIRGSLLGPFSEAAFDFANALSKRLFEQPTIRSRPELAALAFWLRRSNLQSLVPESHGEAETRCRLPRGTALHFAPANVDTIFIYSWIVSLLCGNRNIIRLSSRSAPQLETLYKALDECLAEEQHAAIAKITSVVRYDRSDDINAELSRHADLRVIWGGDESIQRIRRSPLPPTATEVCFANKNSLAAIDEAYWISLGADAKRSVANSFAIDSFQFGQSACSSPRALVWISPNDRSDTGASEEFWSLVPESDYFASLEFQDVDFVDKLVTQDLAACRWKTRVSLLSDNRITRVAVGFEDLDDILTENLHCGMGYFYETRCSSPHEIVNNVRTRKLQTIAYAGPTMDTWKSVLESSRGIGPDRIVPFGDALKFTTTWDGMDLFESFSRRVSIS